MESPLAGLWSLPPQGCQVPWGQDIGSHGLEGLGKGRTWVKHDRLSWAFRNVL